MYDKIVLVTLKTRLEELVGVSGAEILMDRPPGGWNDLVTNHTGAQSAEAVHSDPAGVDRLTPRARPGTERVVYSQVLVLQP